METGRVLSMLIVQATRQIKNDQLEAAKRSVDEAIRYYEANWHEVGPGGASAVTPAIVRCQAQVAALLKVKIGKLQAHAGIEQKDNDLLRCGNDVILQGSTSLRCLLKSRTFAKQALHERKEHHHQQEKQNKIIKTVSEETLTDSDVSIQHRYRKENLVLQPQSFDCCISRALARKENLLKASTGTDTHQALPAMTTP